MSKEWIKRSGIASAVGGAVLTLSAIHAPQNRIGADLFMETKRLETRMNSSSSPQAMLYEGKIANIQEDPDYKEFRRQNDRRMIVAGGGVVLAVGGTVVAIGVGEDRTRHRNSKASHLLRRHHA